MLLAAGILKSEAAASSKRASTLDRDRRELDYAPRDAAQHFNRRGHEEVPADYGGSKHRSTVAAASEAGSQDWRGYEEDLAEGGSKRQRIVVAAAKDYAQLAASQHDNKRGYEEAPAESGSSKRQRVAAADKDYAQLAACKPVNKRRYEEAPETAEGGGSKRQKNVAAVKVEEEHNRGEPAKKATHRGVSPALLVHYVPANVSIQRLVDFSTSCRKSSTTESSLATGGTTRC
jgi:hypothetical protein